MKRQDWNADLIICLVLTACTLSLNAQTVAVILPDSEALPAFAPKLSEDLSDHLEVLDSSLVASAFKAVKHPDLFNMTTDEAKTAALAIGCDFLVLVRTGAERRTSFERPEYYESVAAIYVASSRTGRLVYWTTRNAEELSQSEADTKLIV